MKPHETGTNNPIDFPKQTNKYDAHKESIKGKTLTANELADAMDTKGFRYREVKAAVKMLRQFGLAESIIKQQQLEIEALKKQLEPNMFWNYNDAETGYYEINDVIDEEYHNVWDMEVGHEIEIQQAVRLPNIKVRITKISDDDLEWEVVNESK